LRWHELASEHGHAEGRNRYGNSKRINAELAGDHTAEFEDDLFQHKTILMTILPNFLPKVEDDPMLLLMPLVELFERQWFHLMWRVELVIGYGTNIAVIGAAIEEVGEVAFLLIKAKRLRHCSNRHYKEEKRVEELNPTCLHLHNTQVTTDDCRFDALRVDVVENELAIITAHIVRNGRGTFMLLAEKPSAEFVQRVIAKEGPLALTTAAALSLVGVSTMVTRDNGTGQVDLMTV